MLTSRYGLAAAAVSLALVSASAMARACDGPLQSAAEAVSQLPGDVPYQVPDALQALYDEASALVESDPEQCLAVVRRMNALMARHGAGGGAAAPVEVEVEVEGEASGVDPAAILADLHLDDEERLRRRIERASEDEGEQLQAVGDYRDAARHYAGAMRAFAVSRRSAPTALSEIEAAVAEIDTLTREFEQIVVVNAPDDVMHARLEDAVRRVVEARRALERAWQRYHAREAAKADDYIAPLGSPGFQPAPLVDDFIAPLGDAETRAAQIRLRDAERALKQVRNSWNPHVHRTDWTFLDMREGYKQAYKDEYAGFADELKAFDATLDAYMPDRVADFTRRRVELSERHEQRLDAIFNRYAIR